MSHKKRGQLTTSPEWARHLRPLLRRYFWKGERRAERELVRPEAQASAGREERSRPMSTSDVYGSSLALEPALREAEAALGISFEPHESSYRGGDYYRCTESFVLQRNAELDDELAEPEFPSAATILYVSQVADPDAVRRQLESSGGFSHLKRHQA